MANCCCSVCAADEAACGAGVATGTDNGAVGGLTAGGVGMAAAIGWFACAGVAAAGA